MRLIERLKKIDEYFENMPQDVFEEKLIKAGFGKIKPGPLAMDDVITEDDMWIYRVGSNNQENKQDIIIKVMVSESEEGYTITPSVNALKLSEKQAPNILLIKTDDSKKCDILPSDYTIDINKNLKNTKWRHDNEYTALCS